MCVVTALAALSMVETSIVASLTSVPSPDGRELLALSHSCEWLEVRADLVGDPEPNWIRGFFAGKLIYSLRSRDAGGEFEGSDFDRASRLLAASLNYDLVELDAKRDLRPEVTSGIAADKRLVSWHGRPASYDELAAGFDLLSSIPAKLYKLVVAGGCGADALWALSLLKSLKRSDVIAFASGESGLWSRLVAPHLGAPIIFGSAEPSWTSDGDPSVHQLIQDYGLPNLSPVHEIYGIVGNPVRHSLSPRMHNAAYRALGCPAVFVPFQVESFGDFWRDLVSSGQLESLGFSIRGLTVASPHKETALREARVRSPMSRRVGAANVFVRQNGHWKADTTDPEGVALANGKPGFSMMGINAAVVGCGGAGRAIAAALDQAGAVVTLVNRGTERGDMASKLLQLPFVPLSSFRVDKFSVVVNATPVGRNDNRMPFEIEGLKQEAAVIDLVYGKEPTPLVAKTRGAGRLVIDGRDVLEAQVRRQFHMMTGREMPLELVREQL